MRAFKILAFAVAFLASGLVTIVHFDTYFTDFWKIRNCAPDGYDREEYMTSCAGMNMSRYSFGSIALDVQDEATDAIRDADVLVLGNSRTLRSFATTAIDDYFKDKGLEYFIMATEGTNFRGVQLTFEALEPRPRILLINNEIFYSSNIPEAFGDVVANPDKYRTRFAFTDTAQDLQKFACARDLPWLTDFMCSGTRRANWRSHRTGRLNWDLVAEPEQQKVIDIRPSPAEARLVPTFLPNAQEFLAMPTPAGACSILYLVNSPASRVNVLEEMAAELRVQSVFVDVPGLQTYDNSHLDRPNSERWAEAFVEALDPAIENCFDENFEIAPRGADVVASPGRTDIESFTLTDPAIRLDANLTDETFGVPFDRIETAPNLKRLTRKMEMPVRAGETWEVSLVARSDASSRARLQLLRGCDREPVESGLVTAVLTPSPKRFTAQVTYERDHPCQLIYLQPLTEDSRIDVFGYDLRKIADAPAPADEATEDTAP